MKDTSFFEIDRNRLDDEWIRQPKLFFTWAEKLANAKLDLEEAKGHLDLTKAELDLAIRKDPEAFDLEKITEGAISTTIAMQNEYIEAQQAVYKARHSVDVVQAAVTALDHRKRALQDLVALHGQSYFATPQAPAGAKDSIADMKKRKARRTSKR